MAARPAFGPPASLDAPVPVPFLELLGISKSYPGVVALNDVSLSVAAGEVVGLIGENGAGKSTLMKVLGGVVAPSRGVIRIDGHDHAAMTVADAFRARIAFVHQELNLFDNLDVAANVYLGRETLRYGPLRLVDNRGLRALVQPLLTRLGADFGPSASVAELSIAQRQLVEIAKALSTDARLIIMDEPTSSLTLTETERLLRIVADLRAGGVAVIFITHRLGEIIAAADRVVCLRDGRVAGTLTRTQIAHETMTRLMIGRDLKSLYIPPAGPPRAGGLDMRGVVTTAFPAKTVDLAVRHGEILGLAGLIGSGRTSLARAVFGIDPMLAGQVLIDETPIALRSPRDAIARGIYLVPEDRKQSGLILDMSIVHNITLADLPAHATAMLVRPRSEARVAGEQRRGLNIKAPDVSVDAVTLSGGNQQKVVLGKWLSMRPRALIFDEPTRGIDVGSKGEIYQLMRDLADRGVAIIMISSDMEEVIGVSDRIAVMHEGHISGVLEREDFSELNVLRLAIGEAAQHLATPEADPP